MAQAAAGGGTPADTGWVLAGTGAVDSSYGSNTWLNPGFITASDDGYAITSGTGGSQYLKATNFGLSVPGGATITGIEVRFEAKRVGAGVSFDRVRLVKAGVVGSTDRSTGTSLTTSDVLYDYGGASDLWGDTWSDTDVNAATFGAVVAMNTGVFSSARVDAVWIKVHYTT